ncbi:MAG: 3-deoxy-D-manno-octulosonic acid transferase [Deltaproteobacteria bacterium]|nr:3-deoxy-D-manno-octulosonic acid transferase [Deltaproteobacteria bacterium]
MLYISYTILTSMLFILLLPAFWLYTRVTGRYTGHLNERLGFVSPETVQNISGHPRIWIHAASLGEVKVAASIIDALKHLMPDCSLILSTITESGRKLAEDTFGRDVSVIYAPIDFVGSVRKSLTTVRPDVMVFLETEIWPTWLSQAHRMGIKTVLINGRISLKSVSGYLRLRLFFREVLKNFDAFSMIMAGDATRIESMGADPQKIEINGNAKYDLPAGAVDPAAEAKIRRILNLDADDRVFVAGSTRTGEEEMILHAYEKILEKFPDTILVIAPRHIERTHEIGALIKRRGFQYQLWTDFINGKERRATQVVIVNTFGELFNIYSVGTIVFSGGSLVPLGGQNPLEPAVWGKAVFYGPHMENFLDAKAILEAVSAGVTVHNSEVLAEKAVWFLGHPGELTGFGERAREAVLNNEGAAEKHARVIERLLGRSTI